MLLISFVNVCVTEFPFNLLPFLCLPLFITCKCLPYRLFLREFCIEILRSAYNTLVRHVRRVLERSAGQSHDDSYLLWAIQFFMEFNRLNVFQVELVSESLSTNCFHWVVQRIQHHLDMIDSDKRHARIWGKRLHIALKVNSSKTFFVCFESAKNR